MTFDATGVRVMLSGPTDTLDEIEAMRHAIAAWNRAHTVSQRFFFTAEHFQNAVPVYTRSMDGQAVINQQITNHADIVIAVFKHRLGSSTARNEYSGTVEEADLREAEASVHLFFWEGDALPTSVVDKPEQWQRLKQFRATVESEERGLYTTYRTSEELAGKVDDILWKFVNERPQPPRPAHTESARSISLDVRPIGTIWKLSLLDRWIQACVTEAIEDEEQFEEKRNATNSQSTVPGLSAILASTDIYLRKPLSPSDIDDWVASVRKQYSDFDREIAAAAAPSISFEVESGARLEGLQIELVISGALAVERSSKKWGDIWTPLHEPISVTRIDLSPYITRTQAQVRGADTWAENHDGDVVVTIEAGEVRRPTARTPSFELDDALMVPWDSSAESLEYRWTASAANTDQEWSGEGHIQLTADLEVFKRWAHGSED
ncbi:hypothetical protein ACFWCF_12605 [Rhodococcus sp. NPDC060090]|uniref:hypothetical protein n=1 Tax=Rhodococcus sp. NPDC060090 TaxID=3347056 RepID=UPI00364F09D6